TARGAGRVSSRVRSLGRVAGDQPGRERRRPWRRTPSFSYFARGEGRTLAPDPEECETGVDLSYTSAPRGRRGKHGKAGKPASLATTPFAGPGTALARRRGGR